MLDFGLRRVQHTKPCARSAPPTPALGVDEGVTRSTTDTLLTPAPRAVTYMVADPLVDINKHKIHCAHHQVTR